MESGEVFSFRSGSWLGKGVALATVVVFGSAVVWYWRPLETVAGLAGIAVLAGMALACAVWWRVRVDGRAGYVRRYALLLGVLPVAWRTMHIDQIAAVRLHGRRRVRGWHDLWYISVIGQHGERVTLDWSLVLHADEPTALWTLAQRIGTALDVRVENKGLTLGG